MADESLASLARKWADAIRDRLAGRDPRPVEPGPTPDAADALADLLAEYEESRKTAPGPDLRKSLADAKSALGEANKALGDGKHVEAALESVEKADALVRHARQKPDAPDLRKAAVLLEEARDVLADTLVMSEAGRPGEVEKKVGEAQKLIAEAQKAIPDAEADQDQAKADGGLPRP